MKNKLTIAIEKELIPKAKTYARLHGTSLSGIIEDTFRKLPDAKTVSFSGTWKGRFTAVPKKGQRFKKLSEKYL